MKNSGKPPEGKGNKEDLAEERSDCRKRESLLTTKFPEALLKTTGNLLRGGRTLKRKKT